MKTIWKFPIELSDSQDVLMPFGADILSVQAQGGKLCLWAIVESSNTREPKRIFIYGTGHPFQNDNSRYIGTVQQGALVWHVFEKP